MTDTATITDLRTDLGAELRMKLKKKLIETQARTTEISRHEFINYLLDLLDNATDIHAAFAEWKRWEQK